MVQPDLCQFTQQLIGKSSNLFLHDCPIPMYAFCAVAHIAKGASSEKRIGRKCALRELQLKTWLINECNLVPPLAVHVLANNTHCVLNKFNQ